MSKTKNNRLWNIRICNKFICLDKPCLIALFFIVVIGIFLTSIGWPLKLLHILDNNVFIIFKIKISGWLLLHYILYFIIGLICANQFIFFLIIGIVWEMYEYFLFNTPENVDVIKN